MVVDMLEGTSDGFFRLQDVFELCSYFHGCGRASEHEPEDSNSVRPGVV